jgi:hypothetical protein
VKTCDCRIYDGVSRDAGGQMLPYRKLEEVVFMKMRE